MARSFSGREARFGSIAIASVAIVLAILIGINYPGEPTQQALGPDGGETVHVVGPDEEGSAGAAEAGRGAGVHSCGGLRPVPRPSRRIQVRRRTRCRSNTSTSNDVRRWRTQYGVQQVGTVVFDYDGRVERVTSRRRAGADQRADQGRAGHDRTRSTSSRGTVRRVARRLGPDGLFDNRGGAHVATTSRTASSCSRSRGEVPADATVLIVAGPTTDLFPAEIDMLKAYLARGGKVFFLLDPPSKAEIPDLTNVIALLKEWAIDAGQQRRRRRERHGTDAGYRTRGAARCEVRSASDHGSVQPADRVLDGALGQRDHGRSE